MDKHYSLPSKLVLDATKVDAVLSMLETAGVRKIWLYGYFFGHFDAPIEKMIEARDVLKEHGFDTGACSMPVGHPGNSLDPDDPTIDVRIPQHWRYRIDRHGYPVYHCADIEPRMIEDNVAAMKQLRDAGFTSVFLDDDTRQGNWGPEIQGCFCDACIDAFNVKHGREVNRKTLATAITHHRDASLLHDWVTFNCAKVTSLVDALSLPGIELGIMVMHKGDERHGICISDLKARVSHLRVGEDHFSDKSFEQPRHKASEIQSMQVHLARMSPAAVYSETTAFPARALSPENWVFKAKLALVLGIPNLFFMGGTWLVENSYWQTISSNLQEMRWIESHAGSLEHDRFSPVHVAVGEGDFFIPSWPLRAGIPARPVMASVVSGDGAILLVLGTTTLDDAWLGKASSYRAIILDKNAAKCNKRVLDQDSRENDLSLNVFELDSPKTWQLFGKSQVEARELNLAASLRRIIGAGGFDFPFMLAGMDIWLEWVKEQSLAIIVNLLDEPNYGILKNGEKTRDISLEPLEIAIFHVDDAGITMVEKTG